eukprot:SAG11_NODE_91_length_17102_cov_37.671343_10_plen_155_part_00
MCTSVVFGGALCHGHWWALFTFFAVQGFVAFEARLHAADADKMWSRPLGPLEKWSEFSSLPQLQAAAPAAAPSSKRARDEVRLAAVCPNEKSRGCLANAGVSNLSTSKSAVILEVIFLGTALARFGAQIEEIAFEGDVTKLKQWRLDLVGNMRV